MGAGHMILGWIKDHLDWFTAAKIEAIFAADGSIRMQWGDGSHKFRLAIKELEELQEKCNAGPQEIANRLRFGTWRIADVRETIRLGLIGGGKSWQEALTLTVRYIDNRPWAESSVHAFAILAAGLYGKPEDQPEGKATADRPEAAPIGSAFAASTTPAAH